MKRLVSVFGAMLLLATMTVAQKPAEPPCQSACARALAEAAKECQAIGSALLTRWKNFETVSMTALRNKGSLPLA